MYLVPGCVLSPGGVLSPRWGVLSSGKVYLVPRGCLLGSVCPEGCLLGVCVCLGGSAEVGGGVCPGGVCLGGCPPGGCLPRGCLLWGGVSAGQVLPSCEQNE